MRLHVPARVRTLIARSFAATTLETERSWHSHEGGFLGGVERGLVTLKLEDRTCLLGPSAGCWLPPREGHAADCFGAFAGWFLFVPKRTCASLPKHAMVIAPSQLLAAAVKELAASEARSSRRTMLARLVLDQVARCAPLEGFTLAMPCSDGLRTLVGRVLESPGDVMELDAVARLAGMSRRTFTRRFRDETGVSFEQWRQRACVYAAIERLARGESVGEVALAMGYESVSAFIAMFKKHTGFTPRAFARTRGAAAS
jgi:AraC-like DNA-binding protein